MNIKFLKQKEQQEVLVYLVIFLITTFLLIYFQGVSFDFTRPEVVLEEREDFLEIKRNLDVIESQHQTFDRFRPFDLIGSFDGSPGRSNPFIIEGIEIIAQDNLPGTAERIIIPQETISVPPEQPTDLLEPQEDRNEIPVQ